MLNGKFFTGLPPKMMDRVGAAKNRQESHLFWPDDSKSVSATESRQMRRSSLQFEQQPEKPSLQRQSSIGQHDVDTKGMFHKEFAKSSIQFYDNIEEKLEPNRTTLSRSKLARKEIAPKPTATRLELPESVIDEDYTNAKKQQTYTSKIEFYDYADEEPLNNRPRMDMNDKRAMERNSKNSPKLQNKHNVRNLRTDPVVQGAELKFRNDYGRDARTPVNNRNNRKAQYDLDELDYNTELNSRPTYKNKDPDRLEEYERFEENSYDYARRQDADDVHCIENNMRNVRIKPTTKKQVTYQDGYDAGDIRYNEQYYEEPSRARAHMPNHNNAGSYQREQQRPPQQRQQRRVNESNYGSAETQYRENRQRSARSTFNNYNNNGMHKHNYDNDNRNNNNNYNTYHNSQGNNSFTTGQRKLLPKMSTQPPTMNFMEPQLEPSTATDSQLRSDILPKESLSTQSSASTATSTPTPLNRRNARSSAATQRVSVGLPD